MKYVVILGDGMADYRQPSLGGMFEVLYSGQSQHAIWSGTEDKVRRLFSLSIITRIFSITVLLKVIFALLKYSYFFYFSSGKTNFYSERSFCSQEKTLSCI